MSVEPGRAWPRPPVGGWRAEDLDRLSDLPPHTELIDGSLVFTSPQTTFHARAIRALENSLLEAAPPEWDVLREMTVRLGPRDRPEPDVLVVRTEVSEGSDITFFTPGDVLLAVEVVSPDSQARDRGIKPRKYAEAGIRHFWRVEQEDDRVVAYVHALDPATSSYVPTGVHHERLKVDVPFPVDVDLGAALRRR
ncbi:Uma2 family endonuclease [Streptomyces sp. ST2-7A]|uniref:Uma2 family endonuclease n=1 Tax=Streptomyces sp. ST2-7A TaxID=2907214 RepID=UPI001F1A8730|nr:Uma2 family endonuclease [Streptomyces sp. ST2-7A]MCE7078876.1 Uma2 family endonuclease [Streptomyces sp. ST2-7A]